MDTTTSAEAHRSTTPLQTSPPTTPAIGPPLLLQGSPKGESSRTKEVLAKMVSSRIQQATAKFRDSFDYAPPLEPELTLETLQQTLPPTTQISMQSPPGPGDSPPVRGRGRGRGSRGPRGPRGSRGAGIPRGMLQNITNSGEAIGPPMTRSPRGRRSPRSPRGSGPKGSRKVKSSYEAPKYKTYKYSVLERKLLDFMTYSLMSSIHKACVLF